MNMLDRNPIDPLLRDPEVEEILRVAHGWAAKDRVTKASIPFLKIGRSVRYRESDVRAYMDRCVRRSTSDAGEATAAA
jgi:predicted DNA-binding transcriptional regulator AlpA